MISLKGTGNESYDPSCGEYGYGTSIRLTEDQVKALGLKANPPAAGSSVGLKAIAIVTTVIQNAGLDGDADGVDVCLCLQITDLEITGAGTGPSLADALYT